MREFVELAFRHAGRTIKWRGEGLEEVGFDAETGEDLIEIDPRYFRPTEVEELLGDASKAKRVLDPIHNNNSAYGQIHATFPTIMQYPY